jgi:GDP-L-fucose synthase
MPTNLYGPGDNFDLENSHALPALIRKFHLAKLAAGHDRVGIQQDEAVFGPIPEDFRAGLRGADAGDDTPGSTSPVVRLWGSGRPRREFLYVDDLASACLRVMSVSDGQYADIVSTHPSDAAAGGGAAESPRISHINIGAGTDLTVGDLARIVQDVVGYDGDVLWDSSRPDGAPQKLLDISRIRRLGWQPKTALAEGVAQTYHWYLDQIPRGRRRSPR